MAPAHSSCGRSGSARTLSLRALCTWSAQAQRTRAPIQRLADIIAARFVQVVIAIALLTGAVWWFFGPEPAATYALLNAVAVLIIACPCAVGLATPISMTVAMGEGARAGILFRNAEAIERMRDIDTLVLDKTGTLTVGKPALTDLEVDGMERDDALVLLASAEQPSEHPIAHAIVQAARERKFVLGPSGRLQHIQRARGRGSGRAAVASSWAVVRSSEQRSIDTSPVAERAPKHCAEKRKPWSFSPLMAVLSQSPASLIPSKTARLKRLTHSNAGTCTS